MLSGTWISQGAEFGGEALPVKPSRLVIHEDRYVVEGEAGRDEGRLVVDATVSPATLDLVGVTGPNAGQTIPAIFRMRGNLLQLCYTVGPGAGPQVRPTALTAAAGTMQVLVRYRRETAG